MTFVYADGELIDVFGTQCQAEPGLRCALMAFDPFQRFGPQPLSSWTLCLECGGSGAWDWSETGLDFGLCRDCGGVGEVLTEVP